MTWPPLRRALIASAGVAAGWLLAAPGKNPNNAHSKANRTMVMGFSALRWSLEEKLAPRRHHSPFRVAPRPNFARTIAADFSERYWTEAEASALAGSAPSNCRISEA